jgi:hypothetical protein
MEIRSSIPEEDPDVWILPPKSRYEIYLDLFVATKAPDDDVFPEPVFRDIVLGKVNILKKLQAFILQTYKIESETSEDRKAKRPGRADQGQRPVYDAASVDSDAERKLPNVQYFVDDIVTLIHCLTKVVYDEATPDDISGALEAFDVERQEFWSWRWRGIVDWDGEHRWPAYSCALRDALFGLWPTKGKDEYHTGEWDECIHETLDTTNADPDYEPYDLHERDLRILDAAYIESHGPFRFIPTHSIDDHLRITQRRYINIYVDWRTLGGIRHHTVLAKRKGNRTVFDILMKCKHSSLSKRPFLISLHHHMQISIMLFFFQDETKPGWSPRQPRSLLEAFYTRFTKRRTSLAILRSLEKDISITSTPEEMNERGEVYVKTIKSWALMVRRDSEYRCLFAFRQRMDDLVKTLQEWKPTTFWELRYSGYGGVDGVGLWGYYVALIVGGLTLLITVAAAILQTYAGFRSLNPSG